MSTDARLQKLAEENRRLAEELEEAQEILRALRGGEIDALVSSGNDAVYAVQLIALAVDKAETYLESLALLLKKVCDATNWTYGEAWAASENRRSLQRTPAWFGTDVDAVRLHESLTFLPLPVAEASMLQALRAGEPQWVAIGDLTATDAAGAMRRCGLHTGLALPVIVDGNVTAVLWLWRKAGGERNGEALLQARRILEQAAPFVQRKREEEVRRNSLDALKGMVHERSRRLAELSGMLEQQRQGREHAEHLSRDHEATSLQSKQALEKQSALLQSILDGMADGVVVTDPGGRVLQFNPAARRVLGDLPGNVPLERWPEIYGLFQPGTTTHLTGDDLPLAKAARGEMTDGVEIFVKSSARPSGRTIVMSARPLLDHDNSTYGAVAVFQDVTESKRREAQRIQRLVEQRDLLVREVHHRIKNNLAGVIALLHQHTSEHPESSDLLAKLETQLYTVASMHGLEAAGNGGILFGSLIRSLSENTQSLLGTRVKADVAEDALRNLRLSEAESVPLALALNELLVNAHKHGSRGLLEIRATPDGKGVRIEIGNEVEPGARVPDLSAAAENGGGLGLVRALLPHERARLEFERTGSRITALVYLPAEVFDAVN